MDINRAALAELQRQADKSFQAGMEAFIDDGWLSLVTQTPSFTASNMYIWLDRIPAFKQWIEGTGRDFEDVVSRTFAVKNIEYEDSIRLAKNNLKDSSAGQVAGIYDPLLQMLGDAWMQRKVDSVVNTVLDNATAWDGTAMFANARTGGPYGDNTIDNLDTVSLSATNFEAAIAKMGQYKFGNGQNARVRPTHLIVGPTLRTTAWNIVSNTRVTDTNAAIDNPNNGLVNLIVTPEFNSTAGAAADVDAEHYWAILDCSKPIKPVVLQIREEASPMMDTDPVTLMRTGFVDYMANGRIAAAPTHPHLAYISQATS